MGIGVVLLIWAVVGTIVAIAGALVVGGTTAFLTRRATRWRRIAIVVACLSPFACFAWAGAVFMFQALVNEGLLHGHPRLRGLLALPTSQWIQFADDRPHR